MASLLTSLLAIFQDTTYLLAVIVGLLFLYWLQLWLKYQNYPPGPWGLPIVGYAPFMGEDTLTFFAKLRDKYGDICSINQGSNLLIVLNTLDGIREVFVKQADNFAGLTDTAYTFKLYLGNGKNVFLSEGEIWKEQKRFIMNGLRDFGFGKLKLEKGIQEEAEHALRVLRDLEGQPYDLLKSRLLARMTCNTIANLVFGRRFDPETPKLDELLTGMDDIVSAFSQTSGVEAYPILRYLPSKWNGMDTIIKAKNTIFGFVEEMVKEHVETFDPNDMRDLTDIYHKAVLDRKAIEGKEIPPYTEEMLVSNMILLFQAGTDDGIALLVWMLMAAAMYPDCQKKAQEEMDRVVGRSRLPSWMDKDNMTYYEAFCLEVQRVGAPFPLTILHTSTVETTVMGYRLPARTEVMGNTWLLYRDKKIWGDPDNFRPERFIDEDGKINRLRDIIMTFGIGKRTCLGQGLAKMQTFIYFTSFIQSFTLTLPTDTTGSEQKPSPDVRRLTSCRLCAIPRD